MAPRNERGNPAESPGGAAVLRDEAASLSCHPRVRASLDPPCGGCESAGLPTTRCSMSHHPIDVLTLGNAIVDVLAHTDEAFLVSKNVHKGAMQLIDEARADELFGDMGPRRYLRRFGRQHGRGRCLPRREAGFIGKVKDDETGRHFAHDLGPSTSITTWRWQRRSGHRPQLHSGDAGRRAHHEHLSGRLPEPHSGRRQPRTVEASSIVYLEGYLWDPPAAKEAFRKAVKIAHQAGNKVALTLSDAFCVDRYRDEFLGLIRDGSLDILFANIHELQSLFQTSDADTALAALRDEKVLGVVTRSAEGALVVTRGETRSVPAFPVARVVDTTGAGDLFAAGFMAGLARDLDLTDCARLGGLAAAEVISHLGARPQTSLLDLARQEGLLA